MDALLCMEVLSPLSFLPVLALAVLWTLLPGSPFALLCVPAAAGAACVVRASLGLSGFFFCGCHQQQHYILF